jgi:putative phosphoesterase
MAPRGNFRLRAPFAAGGRTGMTGARSMRVGLISDTHGLLRPEAVRALKGVQRIIHGGDIGGPEVLEALGAIAPVEAVRGNNDRGAWARTLPADLTLELAGVRLYVLHDLKELALDPAAAGLALVITGHSHQPGILESHGVLYVNPGSAGPRRFRLPVTVAHLWLHGGRVQAEIQHLL